MSDITEQADKWIEKWISIDSDERELIKELSRRAAHDAIAYGSKGQTWQDWDKQEKYWRALSSEAQKLCKEARTIWSPLLKAVREEVRQAGVERAQEMTPEELLMSDDSYWKIWEAAVAACWGPCEKPE